MKLFSNTPLAKLRNYKPGFFSFNVVGGRCEMCEGEGVSQACSLWLTFICLAKVAMAKDLKAKLLKYFIGKTYLTYLK